MSHTLLEGRIKILKVVTPGAYWVQCSACEGSCRIPEDIRRKPISNEHFYPHQGEKVFVRDEDGFFYRGTICGRRLLPGADFWSYVVQLTDTFQVKDFYQEDVYPTYHQSSTACGSCHLVSLDYLFPQLPPAKYGKDAVSRSDEWDKFENKVVNWCQSVEHLKLTKGRQFSCELRKIINGSIYGSISMFPPLLTRDGTQCRDLSEYLCLEELAAKQTFRFEEVVKTLMTSPLIDYATLLPTFDLSGKVTFKPKLAPDDPFKGFKVHPDDVALHLSLCSDYYTNIIFTGPPLIGDRIVRYLHPKGHAVLGTVQNVSVKFVKEEEETRHCNMMKTLSSYTQTNGKHANFLNPESTNEDTASEPDNPGQSLLSYCFNDSKKNFQAAGGIFKERFTPYPYFSAIEETIVEQLYALGVDSLQAWQQLCLPSFSCKKNLVIIGPKSTGKLSTSLICALSWMSYSDVHPHAIQPQLIVFFRDHKRAEEKAKLCSRLSNFRVIVSTSLFVSEKQKAVAANGCDILLTTPRNWAALVCEGVFDFSRLEHVIFDEFDQLHEACAEDVKRIFEVLRQDRRRVQTIVVSKNGCGSIRRQGLEFPTECVMGVVPACCYYGLTPFAVFVKPDDDWMEQYIRNIFRARGLVTTENIIFLCKDEEEGTAIVNKLPESQPVQFVTGKLSERAALKIVRSWDGKNGEILVCTDDWTAQLIHLNRVDIMVSWMTSSWDTLSSRFKAFSSSLAEKDVNLSTSKVYLFCHPEKLEQLTILKNISNSVNSVNGMLSEHLSRAAVRAECGKFSPICPSLFMFGKCHDVLTCTLRHFFLPEDNIKVIDVRQYLNVDILKVHSAIRYSVRVKEVVSNCNPKTFPPDVSALVSKLDVIQNGLWRFRHLRSPRSLTVGQMVGAKIPEGSEVCLRRVTVKSIPDKGSFYSFSIVDYAEPDVCLPLSQVFVLPEDIARLPKDVIDLYIAGLQPFDILSDWEDDTHKYVSSAINQIIKSSNLLAGKVEIIGKRLALVDSLFCFKDNGPFQKTTMSMISTEFLSLKDFVLEGGYCVKNPNHLDSLSELIAELGNLANGVCAPLDPVGRYGHRKDLPKHAVQAEVSSYDDPGLFYVKLTGELEKLADLERRLSSTLEGSGQKLSFIGVGELCAIKYQDAWNRALITDVTGHLENPVAPVIIIFVDYGDTLLEALPDKLHQLPDEFANVPFFAIQCQLVGVQPIKENEWDAEAVNAFRSFVRNTSGEMSTLKVKFHSDKSPETLSNYYRRYLVTLWGHYEDLSINQLLNSKGLAGYDPDTKPMLEERVVNGTTANGTTSAWPRHRSKMSSVGIPKKVR